VKGRIVHADNVSAREERAEQVFQPAVKHLGIARAFKQEWHVQPSLDVSRDQRGARLALPRGQSIHTPSLKGIGVAAGDEKGKPAFIPIHQGLATAAIALP